jgi:hypothetical protein
MFLKEVRPATACRKTIYSRDTVYIRNDSSRDVNSSRNVRISRRSATVGKPAACSRDTRCQRYQKEYGSQQIMNLKRNTNCSFLSNIFQSVR